MKIKKSLSLMVISVIMGLAVFSSSTELFAQTGEVLNSSGAMAEAVTTSMPESEASEEMSEAEKEKKRKINDISSLHPRFCNRTGADGKRVTSKSLTDTATAGSDKEICLAVLNNSDREIDVTMYFVDAIKPADGSEKYTCNTKEKTQEHFGLFSFFPASEYNGVKDPVKELNFKIGPEETVEKRGMVKFPQSYTGTGYGCLITTSGKTKSKPGAIAVRMRRGSIIKLDVDGMGAKPKIESIGLDYKDGMLKTDEEQGNYVITQIKNDGNVALDYEIVNTISNSFGFEDVGSSSGFLNQGETKDVRIPVGQLPFYKMGFDTNTEYKYKVNFGYNADVITEKDREEMSISKQGRIFLFPLELSVGIVAIIVIIFLILFLFKGKSNSRPVEPIEPEEEKQVASPKKPTKVAKKPAAKKPARKTAVKKTGKKPKRS